MKTIKRKISTPFLMIIIMIPAMIMILFNIAMNIYVDHTAKEELKNSISSIEILARRQLMDNALNRIQDEIDSVHSGDSAISGESGNSADSADRKLTALRDGLRLSKLSLLNSLKEMNIEFLIVSSDGKVLFPKTYEDSFLNDRIVNKTKLVLSGAEENTLKEVYVGRNKYFSTYRALTEEPDSARLIFISSRNSADSMIRLINTILLCITLIAVGISSIIALIVSKSISLPIIRLTAYAKKIGGSNDLTMEEDSSSVEIHELTKSMNEMNQRIRNYDHAQKSFLQNASHELRTPLMSIQGYAEGIVKGVFPDTVKTAEIICEESRRLNLLVEELLTLSRIENNNYNSNPAALNLSDFMKDYLQRINGYAIREEKVIVLNILKEGITVKADDLLLSQAVINILSNCIKYARKEVTVTVSEKNKLAEIKISDDGDGISEKDLPHIFERFYKGTQGNFGLGLSIAKSAIEFMNGEIEAYNESGAVFLIRLPLLPVPS